jgi:hypothetical protein
VAEPLPLPLPVTQCRTMPGNLRVIMRKALHTLDQVLGGETCGILLLHRLPCDQSVDVTGRIFPPLLSAAAAVANVGTLGVTGDGWGIRRTGCNQLASIRKPCRKLSARASVFLLFVMIGRSVGCPLVVLIMAIMVMMMSSWRLANAERERETMRKRQSIVVFDRTTQRNLE